MTEYASLVLKVDSTQAKGAAGDLDGLTDSSKKTEAGFGSLKTSAVAVGVALAGAAVAAAAMMKASIDNADAASKSAQSAGISVEQYTRLAYAMELSVQGSGALDGSMKFLNKSMFDASTGSKTAQDAFTRLGVSYANADGTLRDSTAVMLDVSDRFATMADGAEKSALSMDIFGKSGADLVPFLNQGSDAINEMTAQADRLGVTLNGDTARAAELFNDNITVMQGAVKGLVNEVMAGLLPALNDAHDTIVENADAIKTGATVLTSATAAYIAVTVALNAKTIALRAAAAAQALFNTAAKANPYALAAAGVTALVATIWSYNKAAEQAAIKTDNVSTSLTRFEQINRRAAEAILAQNRAAAGMTLPGIKQKIDEVSGAISHLTTLHKRASDDFNRGAVSAGLVAAYDEQLQQKKKQLEYLNALIGEKQMPVAAAAAVVAQKTAAPVQAAIPVEPKTLGPTEDDVALWLESEANAQSQVNALREGFRQADEANEAAAAARKLSLQSGFMSDMMSMMNSKSKTLFKIGKAAAIANALLKAKESVVNAYAYGSLVGGPVLGAVFGGIAAAAQAANIASIAGQSFGGGGGVSSAGGGTGVTPVSSETVGNGLIAHPGQARAQTTDIRLTGIRPDDMISGSYLQKIIEGIGETLADNGGRMGRVELVTA